MDRSWEEEGEEASKQRSLIETASNLASGLNSSRGPRSGRYFNSLLELSLLRNVLQVEQFWGNFFKFVWNIGWNQSCSNLFDTRFDGYSASCWLLGDFYYVFKGNEIGMMSVMPLRLIRKDISPKN